jgi:small neutral amino acid transporter SnatA (MarC family)
VIWESALLAVCLYGLMKEDDVLRVAATVSILAFPALMLFTRAGAGDIVMLLLAVEAVPFAFSLLVMKVAGVRNYRRLWK